MTTPPLLIHIGYHKTATTWMQHRLFVPAHGYRKILDQYTAFNQIARPHGLLFDPSSAEKVIKNELKRVSEGESGVISSESLSGHPFFGGRESDVFARRLALVAPEARILISVRNQMKILPSVYMQYLLRGGTMNHVQFFEGKTEVQNPSFSLEHFAYHRLIQLYQELFGKRNVFILSNESLRNDEEVTLRRLAKFAGNTRYSRLTCDAHEPFGQSYPEYAAPILRRINHVQTSTINRQPIISLGKTPKGLYRLAGFALKKPPFKMILQKYRPVSTYVQHKFSDYFIHSNQRLEEIAGPELVLKGYPGIGE